MKTRARWIVLSIFLFGVMLRPEASVDCFDSELVGLLTQDLGVTTEQAKGGAGAIFNAASQNMNKDDFAKVTDALPEALSLMKAAPAMDSGSGSGTTGALSSMMKSAGGSLGSLTDLAGAFSKLGLSTEMVGKYIPIVLEYAQSKGGETVANLLKAALQ